MSERCILCRRGLGLLELVHDTPAGPSCSDCDSELPEQDRPTSGPKVDTSKNAEGSPAPSPKGSGIRGPYTWPRVRLHQRPVTRPAWPQLSTSKRRASLHVAEVRRGLTP